MKGVLNISRVQTFLIQESRKMGLCRKNLEVQATLRGVITHCGDFSQNRKMARRIGLALMSGCHTIVCPVCFFATELERYPEHTALFMEKQCDFLARICAVAPELEPVFLVPEQEASNEQVQRVSRRNSAELGSVLADIRRMVTKIAAGRGWKCLQMTEFMDDPVGRERTVYAEILSGRLNNVGFETQVNKRLRLSVQRAEGVVLSEARVRTARWAAQYVSLGRFASARNAMICNQTTINLHWFRLTDAAVLHNPVTIP